MPSRIGFAAALALVAASPSAYAQADDPLTRGKDVFERWCAMCHGEDTVDSGGGTHALQILYQGAVPAELEDRTDMTAEFIELLVRRGRAGMPNFRLTEISESELNDLNAYLMRNNEDPEQ